MRIEVERAKRFFAGRSGRKVTKLMVVACGLVWCSSWPGLLVGAKMRSESIAEAAPPTAQQLAALADAPDSDLSALPAEEAAARVRALLTRRGPGDLERAGYLLERALQTPPSERARRRQLERLRAAWRRVVSEENTLCRHAAVPGAPQTFAKATDAAPDDRPGPIPLKGYR